MSKSAANSIGICNYSSGTISNFINNLLVSTVNVNFILYDSFSFSFSF